MSPRILVVEDSPPLAAALQRAVLAAGYEVDVLPQRVALAAASPGGHAVAIVHADRVGAELVKAFRDVDPHLPVVALFLDEDEAAAAPDAFGADGVLVGPLNAPAIIGTVRLAERYAAAVRHAAELAAVAARRVDSAQELAFLKRVLLLEVKRSRRYGYPVSLALLAVDRWAETSGAVGPARAVTLMAELLAILNASLRDIDLAVPFGEDRVVVLLPHTASAGALRVARRLVARIRERPLTADDPTPVTASAGVAGHDGQGTVSFGSLVKRATTALGRAVEAGGDRAEPAEPSKRDRVVMG
jgi:diguanylate cyclase (GGDEF)-like protein